MLGNRLKKPSKKDSFHNKSFSYSKNDKNRIKNSELVRYIDSYLIQSKQKVLPQIEKKVQQIFPLQLSKPMHTLYAPFKGTYQKDEYMNRVFINQKKKTPGFSEMKKNYRNRNRRNIDVAKSQDDRVRRFIQGSADKRPKSVLLNKKVSCIMQTDEFF